MKLKQFCHSFFPRFVSVGDVAHVGSHPPNVAAVYNNTEGVFALPVGYDLVSISHQLV